MRLTDVTAGLFSYARTPDSGQRTRRRRNRCRETGLTAQVPVDGGGGAAALGDSPDDQRLAAAHVPGGEDARDRGGVRAVPGDVTPLVEIDAEAVEQARPFGPGEAHGQQHQVSAQLALGTGHWVEPLGGGERQRPAPARVVAEELQRGYRVGALAALLVRARYPVDHRVGGPRLVAGPDRGRLGQDLELVHRGRALPVRGAQAVRAGVTAADDDHVPPA